MSKRRPARKELEALIRETGGNVTKLAERLGCSRETAYRWIYQLRLDRVVGIAPEPKAPPAPPGPSPGKVEPRRAVTVKLPEELWVFTRVEAIRRRTTASSIVELALERLRAEWEQLGGTREKS